MTGFFSGMENDWWFWALLIIIGFPILEVLLGEIAHRLERHAISLAKAVRFMQHFLIPQFILLLIMLRILELPEDHLFVKILETSVGIFAIYSMISFFNLLIFSETGNAWQIKAPKLLLEVIRVIIVLVGSAIVLSNVWELELGKMLAAFGVGSLIIGLALKDTVSSLFAGFALLSSRQFREGDWLQVDNSTGRVVNVNWRTTTLLNRDGDIIILPNAELLDGKVVNFSHPFPRHRERIEVGFSYDDPPYKVKDVLITAALDTTGVLHEPQPSCHLCKFSDSVMIHEIRFWVESYNDSPNIRDRMYCNIWYSAKRAGLTFSFPVQEIHITKQMSMQTLKKQQQEAILTTLQHCGLLSEQSEAKLRIIAEHSRLLLFAQSNAIIRQDHYSSDWYILANGKASKYYEDSQGQKHLLNTLRKGDVFGIASLVRNRKDDVSVYAEVDTEIIAVDGEFTQQLLLQHPDLALTIEKLITHQRKNLQHYELS